MKRRATMPKDALRSRWVLPLSLSSLLHGGLGGMLWVVPSTGEPDRRAPIELTDRQLPEPTPPPAPPEPEEVVPPPTLEVQPRPPRPKPRPSERPPAKASPPPAEGKPEAQAEPAPDTGARTFGLEMEGLTVAPAGGQGVAVPGGDTIDTDPAVRRVGKGKPRAKPGGFKKDYGEGELAPVAVVTAMPRVLERAQPEYPEAIRDLEIEGQVVADLRIDGTGKVIRAKIVRGLHPVLDAAALVAARRTRFAPARVGDIPVSVNITYTFTFVLD